MSKTYAHTPFKFSGYKDYKRRGPQFPTELMTRMKTDQEDIRLQNKQSRLKNRKVIAKIIRDEEYYEDALFQMNKRDVYRLPSF